MTDSECAGHVGDGELLSRMSMESQMVAETLVEPLMSPPCDQDYEYDDNRRDVELNYCNPIASDREWDYASATRKMDENSKRMGIARRKMKKRMRMKKNANESHHENYHENHHENHREIHCESDHHDRGHDHDHDHGLSCNRDRDLCRNHDHGCNIDLDLDLDPYHDNALYHDLYLCLYLDLCPCLDLYHAHAHAQTLVSDYDCHY